MVIKSNELVVTFKDGTSITIKKIAGVYYKLKSDGHLYKRNRLMDSFRKNSKAIEDLGEVASTEER